MRWLVALMLLAACIEKPKAPPAPPPKPVPLEPLIAEAERLPDGGDDSDTVYRVKPFSFTGEAPPANALRLEITGEIFKLGGEALTLEALKPKLAEALPVLLSFDEETYLAQVQPLLALLDDAHSRVWLQSPDVAAIAWPVRLRDEPAFSAWVDESVPGKVRVIQRADGFEVQTNMGKLPGGDLKGPTVPLRGGKLDLVTLQKGLDLVKKRFHEAPDACFLPSFATLMRDAIRAVAANWLAADKVVFDNVCLVYPRPTAKK